MYRCACGGTRVDASGRFGRSGCLHRHYGWGCLLLSLNGGSGGWTVDGALNPRETEDDAVTSVHDEWDANKEAHEQHSGG